MMAEILTASMTLLSTPPRSTTPETTRHRLGRALLGWLAAGSALIGAWPATAQDLVGCQLVDGTLQCVPGLTASPQQQIKIMRKEISTDIQLEGAVQQQINGLDDIELVRREKTDLMGVQRATDARQCRRQRKAQRLVVGQVYAHALGRDF